MPSFFSGIPACNAKIVLNKQSFFKLLFLFVLLLPIHVLAQKRVTGNIVADRAGSPLPSVFKQYSLFSIDSRDMASHAKTRGNNYIDFNLELPGYPAMALKLLPNNILSADYKLHAGTANGMEVLERPEVMTYKGRLANDDASSVYLSISKNLIYGFIRGNGKRFFIEPLRYLDKNGAADVYVFYNAEDVRPYAPIACGVTELDQRAAQQQRSDAARGTAIGTCRMVELAIASDDSMFIKYGTVQAVAEHNIAAVNVMAGTYSNAQLSGPSYLEFVIRGQYVATVQPANPYLAMYTSHPANANTMLENFTTWGQAGKFGFSNYDIAQLWTSRDIAQESPAGSGNYSYGVLGLAYVSASCGAFRYQILEDARISGEMLASVATHETGHNLGAQHDNPGDLYVMAPSITNPPNLLFSTTSLTAISAHISGSGGACFSACNTAIPNTQFNSSPKAVCVGSSISFTDYSTGLVTSRSWSFPGGSPATSTAASQAVTYSTPGIKTITLTTTNSAGSSSITKTVFVGTAPIAACLTNTAGSGQQGGLLNFNMADINFTTGTFYIGGRYDSYTCSDRTSLMPGTTYTGTAIVGFKYLPAYDLYSQLEIFIDYNNDGDFLDAGEGVYFSNNCSQGNVGFSFTTPVSVPVINTFLRMRVIGRSCSLPPTNGCAIPNNSHIKDYSVFFTVAQPCITYVNAAATGSNNGTSWANAYTDLQSALAVTPACEQNQVWVAAGNYKPTSGTDRNASFAQKNNLSIIGGFPATGNPGLADRNPILHETILSGEIGTAANTDNSYHVLNNTAALDATAVLDGFIITGGFANGAGPTARGGGLYNDPPASSVSTPLIRNCLFRNNSSNFDGGAVFNEGMGAASNSSPVFINCVFQSNSSVSGLGGAVFNNGIINGISSPVFTNCTFTGNSAPNASVMYSIGSSAGVSQPAMRNSIVFDNGGTSNFANSSATLTISHSYLEPGVTGFTAGAGNIISSASPFAAVGHIQLSDTSAAINAGSNTAAPDNDITLQPRAGNADMGAFENKQTCHGADKIYISNISGTAYHWQRNTGSGYENLSNDASFSNVTASMLTIAAPPKTSTGHTFRCMVTTAAGTVYSHEFTLRFFNYWLGTADNNWQNLQNWGCGEVPDQYTDVILKGAKNNYPTQNVNGAVRILQAENGSTITLSTGNNLQVMGVE